MKRSLSKYQFACALTTAAIIASSACSSAMATDMPPLQSNISGEPDPFDKHAKQILLNEVSLAKSNLFYRMNAAKQGRWKGLRYFVSAETNAALTESGLIVAVAERMSHIHGKEYKHLHRGALMHGNVLGGVGQTIGGAGSILEFLINGYHSLEAAHKGFFPTQAKRHTLELVNKIDGELGEYERLADEQAAKGNQASAEIYHKEARVMTDIRDLLIAEFNAFHSGARQTLWSQQSFYVLDTAKNAIGAVGNLYGYKALRQQHRIFNKPAGVLVLVSGAMIMGDPIVSKITGRAMGILDRYLLLKSGLRERSGLGQMETTVAKMQADTEDLRLSFKQHSGEHSATTSALQRLDMFEIYSASLDKRLAERSREVRRGNRKAVQSVLAGLFVGGTKLTNGIEFTIAGYKYHENPRMTNVMLGTGAIPYLAGSAVNIADNLRIQVLAEIDRHKLGKKHELPGQLLKQHLADLDTLEKNIEAL